MEPEVLVMLVARIQCDWEPCVCDLPFMRGICNLSCDFGLRLVFLEDVFRFHLVFLDVIFHPRMDAHGTRHPLNKSG